MLHKDLQSDFDALLPGGERAGASRRTALKAALGLGYAAAAAPLMAQTAIHTSSEGLVSGWVQVPSNGFSLPVYRSAPAGRTGLPVVLVVQEIFGVHEYIADVTRRLARQGYLALAPDLYRRQGDAAAYTEIGRLMSEVVSKVPDEQVLGDLDSVARWAGEQGGNLAQLGITGFCWGGRIAWLYAAHNPGLKAAVAWYGRLTGQSSPLTPHNPIDLVGQIHAPVLGLYGGQDTGITAASINEFKAAIAASGSAAAKDSEFVIYPDAGHAFHADYRSSYRQAAAEDGWKRLLAWFKLHGVA